MKNANPERSGIGALDEHGFTLIEVMTAVTFIVVALIPILLMFHASSKSNEKAAYRSVAMSLAQERIEQLRDVEYDTIVSGSDAAIVVDLATFNRAITVTTPETNLKQIVVTVTWTDTDGSKSISLTTYRAKY